MAIFMNYLVQLLHEPHITSFLLNFFKKT